MAAKVNDSTHGNGALEGLGDSGGKFNCSVNDAKARAIVLAEKNLGVSKALVEKECCLVGVQTSGLYRWPKALAA